MKKITKSQWIDARGEKLYQVNIGAIMPDEDGTLTDSTNWRDCTVIAISAEDAIDKVNSRKELVDKSSLKKDPYMEYIESVVLIRELNDLVK